MATMPSLASRPTITWPGRHRRHHAGSRGFHRRRPDDDVGQAHVEVFFDGVQVADAATQLNRHVVAHFLQDGADDIQVLGFAGKGTVQVHQMQATGALVSPVSGHLTGSSENTVASSMTPCFRRTH
jgi:fatty-acid desaturase